jgi:hypothetical protein
MTNFKHALVTSKHSKISAFFSVLLTALLSVSLTPCMAQLAPAKPSTTPVEKKIAAPLNFTAQFATLDWQTLTPVQQTALKPLATSWKSLSDTQKRKWLSISANYPQLNIEDQSKLHARMAQWAALSPPQREQARLNFSESKKIPAEKKNEQWLAYQALSAEEKQKLAKSVQPKAPRTALTHQSSASDQIQRLPIYKSVSPASSGLSTHEKTLLVRPVTPTPPKPPLPPVANDPVQQQ